MHAIALALNQLGRVGDKTVLGLCACLDGMHAHASSACKMERPSSSSPRGSHGMSGRNLPDHRRSRNVHAIKMHATNLLLLLSYPKGLVALRSSWMTDFMEGENERERMFERVWNTPPLLPSPYSLSSASVRSTPTPS